MMLQKWFTLSNTDQFTPECLKKCENLDKQHINLLLHIAIQWLSRGRVLNRVPELEGEPQDYFQGKSMPDFAECFENEDCLVNLFNLADIFIT
jgi:hypothetical protein